MKLDVNQGLAVCALSLLCWVCIQFQFVFNQSEHEVAFLLVNKPSHLVVTQSRFLPVFPSWLEDYLLWHAEERRRLNPSDWVNGTRPKLLILQCMWYDRCGGFSDRLNSLPVLLLSAYRSKRIFLIRWRGRPAKLEEFMVPPNSGLDWTIPQWLDDELGPKYSGYRLAYIINPEDLLSHRTSLHSNAEIIIAKPQWGYAGEKEYLEMLGLPSASLEFRSIYHDVFRSCFKPSIPLQKAIDKVYANTNLTLGEIGYSVAHYRALYFEASKPPSLETQVKLAQNAVNCASQLGPPHCPIYFATDSQDAQKIIEEYAVAKEAFRPIVVLPHKKLVHLDRVDIVPNDVIDLSKDASYNNSGNQTHLTKVDISRKTVTSLNDIFPVFVDIWLMANGNCLSHGDGGYGKYGLMVSKNFSCSKSHSHAGIMADCEWRD